jgi:hypothetical protein
VRLARIRAEVRLSLELPEAESIVVAADLTEGHLLPRSLL